MSRFVAIDVETANADMASICSIGVAAFEDGALAAEWYSLLDPDDFSTRSTFRSTGSGSRTCVVRRRSATRRPRSTASLAVRSSSPIPTSTASRWTKPLGDGRSQRLPARGSILRASRWIDGFRRDVESVRGRRMGDDYLDHADVDPECHRAGALFGAHLAVVNQLLPVEVPDLLLLQIGIERGQRCSLAATRRFPYLAHTGYRRVDEVAKGLEAGHGRACRC